MTFTATWTRRARNKLTDIWLAAPDQAVISDAANEIEKTLRQSPETAGEQRAGTTRLVIVGPLAVMYDVYPDDRLVDVVEVRRIR